MPKGSLLKQYRPDGVMNVVSRREGWLRGIYQKPLLASSLVKNFAPVSWARVSSTLGRGWTPLRTLSLRGLRSTQIRIAPDFLGTTTIPAHHGVGSSTLEMIPSDSIRSSSSAKWEWNVTRCGEGMWSCIWFQPNVVFLT